MGGNRYCRKLSKKSIKNLQKLNYHTEKKACKRCFFSWITFCQWWKNSSHCGCSLFTLNTCACVGDSSQMCTNFSLLTAIAGKATIKLSSSRAHQSTVSLGEIALFCYKAMEFSLSRLAVIAVVMLAFCCRWNQSAVLPNNRRHNTACEYSKNFSQVYFSMFM